MVETSSRSNIEWVVDGAWCKSNCETAVEVPEDEPDKHCSAIRQVRINAVGGLKYTVRIS